MREELAVPTSDTETVFVGAAAVPSVTEEAVYESESDNDVESPDAGAVTLPLGDGETGKVDPDTAWADVE